MTRWRYFTLDEFACRGQDCCGGLAEMDEAFIDKLDELRHRVGFPIAVSSGYRCPTHNQRVSSTGPNGPHTTGKASDLRVDRTRAWYVLREAMEIGFTGIGVQQKGNARFLHLDMLEQPPRPTVWSY